MHNEYPWLYGAYSSTFTIFVTILYDRCKTEYRAKGVGAVWLAFGSGGVRLHASIELRKLNTIDTSRRTSSNQSVSQSVSQSINQSIVQSVAKHMGKSSIWPKRVELRFNASHEPQAICICNRRSRVERAVCTSMWYVWVYRTIGSFRVDWLQGCLGVIVLAVLAQLQ